MKFSNKYTKKTNTGGGGGGGGGGSNKDYFILPDLPVPLGALPPTGMSWMLPLATGLAGAAAAAADILRKKRK